MIKKLLIDLILSPYPLRSSIELFSRKFKIGNYKQRLELNAVDRPHYGYCLYNAVVLAKKLGYKKISVLEFGVAGGNGLLNLEYHTEQITKFIDIEIEIYGFDTGEGLPAPIDYRDLPYNFQKDEFKMDIDALRSELKKSKLVLGDIKDTAKTFFQEFNPAPVGFISYDFDYYSSTKNAMSMIEEDEKHFLPRVFCYFDDIVGSDIALMNHYTGVRLAINEFNDEHEKIKFCLPYYLLCSKLVEHWYHSIRICHLFNHSRYNDFIQKPNRQLLLNSSSKCNSSELA